ncbi:polysaccharide deacetylase family protein [Virgibacillus sp.]|uniref:polysaccharide deacetylase family protein n=1 Tax=Virgibacillus sp. TaxID=1872700 RepID=UPI001835ED96|nr:polysaccharide deacetylase family protein [Virgibacillus sp.]NWO14952.1 polysaccharide deacetylase family protein [Virgibacillus sp.]
MFKYAMLLIYLLLSFFPTTENLHAYTEERIKYEKSGDVIWEGYTDEKVVALTFDDGPNPKYTPLILDILDKFNAKATFFVTGSNAKKYPYLIYRQHLENHEIGNHTFNHDYRTKNLKEELKKTATIIYETTGTSPTNFRPPEGVYNDEIVTIASEQGYTVVLWSWDQDPKDWDRPGVDEIVNHVTSNISPGDIILLHDSGGNRSQTVEALPKILEFLDENEYKTITVSEMIQRTS